MSSHTLASDLKSLAVLIPILKRLKVPILLSAASLMLLGLLEPLFAVLMEPFLDESLIGQEPTALYLYPLLFILLFVVKGAVEYVSKVSGHYVVTAIVAELRSRLFSCELRLSVREIETQTNGRLLGRIINDVNQIGNVITQLWNILIKDTVMLFGLVAFLVYTS